MPTIQEVRAQYPQYSDMSDADLAGALHKKFYSDIPREEFDKKIGLATVAQADVSVAGDVLKSGGIGLVKGGLGTLGAPGDIGSLASGAVDMAAGALGAPAGKVQQFKDMAKLLAKANPMLSPFTGPTSQELQKSVENVTGDFYKPQTVPGEYAQTAGEFAPAMIGGPGGFGSKLLSRVAAPAIASETAGQATKGTEFEPYARVAGALAGGAGAAKLMAPKAAAVASVDDLADAASASYKAPEVKALAINPASTKAASGTIKQTLYGEGLDETVAPMTFSLLKRLETPVGNTANVADIDNVRKTLNKIGGNFNQPIEQEASRRAIAGIDDYLANIKKPDVIAGDAVAASTTLKEARANSAAKFRLERVGGAEYRGELNAASANSGQNANNATRQAIKSILLSPSKRRGFNDDEIAQMEKVVKGTATGNAMRAVGKILSTSGMQGGLVAGGSIVAAPATAGLSLALPVAGFAAQKLGDKSTADAIKELRRLIASRSPLAAQMAAQNPQVVKQLGPASTGALAALIAADPALTNPLNAVSQSNR
jgi:hypothetical protein